MSRVHAVALCLVVPLMAACASTGGAGGSGTTSNASSAITRQEIQQAHVNDAYQAVQKLRPQWLRSRGSMSVTSAGPQDQALPVVFVDGQQYGDLSQLRGIQAMDVQSISYLSPNDATTQFGTGHSGGAILVTTVH